MWLAVTFTTHLETAKIPRRGRTQKWLIVDSAVTVYYFSIYYSFINGSRRRSPEFASPRFLGCRKKSCAGKPTRAPEMVRKLLDNHQEHVRKQMRRAQLFNAAARRYRLARDRRLWNFDVIRMIISGGQPSYRNFEWSFVLGNGSYIFRA